MLNNDILKKLRFILDYGDDKMMDVFSLGGLSVGRPLLSNWLKKEEDPQFVKIVDQELAHFLNGLIVVHRGKKEGEDPIAEERLNNNLILRKLRIAFNYKDEDMLDVLKAADFNLSKHELSAFFRNPSAPQYRPCKDQVMRNFLMGMQLRKS